MRPQRIKYAAAFSPRARRYSGGSQFTGTSYTKPMFDPSEPTEEELLAARDVPLEELRAKAKRRADEMGDDPFQDASGLIMAVHAEKVYQYELQRRREAL